MVDVQSQCYYDKYDNLNEWKTSLDGMKLFLAQHQGEIVFPLGRGTKAYKRKAQFSISSEHLDCCKSPEATAHIIGSCDPCSLLHSSLGLATRAVYCTHHWVDPCNRLLKSFISKMI